MSSAIRTDSRFTRSRPPSGSRFEVLHAPGRQGYNPSMPLTDANLKTLAAFAETAEEFCRFIDRFWAGRPERLYTSLETLLLNVHAAILPVQKEMAEQEHPECAALAMTHDQWREIADIISVSVGPESQSMATEHRGLSTEATAGLCEYDAQRAEMLWDDLADIYRDLRRGLALWKMGTVDGRTTASWGWRYNFEIHWGMHVLRAMQTVHEIRYRLLMD